jgi:hypothetical protein
MSHTFARETGSTGFFSHFICPDGDYIDVRVQFANARSRFSHGLGDIY